MKIVRLEAENFKILRAIEIAPDGNIVTIGGKNGQGKSSILDAVWVALAGRSKAPPQPIRKGEEKCKIALDLGEIIITRTFTAKEGGNYTDNVKVESADGSQRFNRPQQMLDELLGGIGFDPFSFVQLGDEAQAQKLLEMVPLPIDLEELAEADAADYQARRDTNRDAASLKAQIDAIPEREVPEDAPDREALTQKLAEAGDHNVGIERESIARQQRVSRIEQIKRDSTAARQSAERLRAEAAELIREAEGREADAKSGDEEAAKLQAEYDALPELAAGIDTQAVRQQLAEAEATLAEIERQSRRKALIEQHEGLVAKSEGFSKAMEDRETQRRDALSKARMPIDGLGFAVNDRGKPVVLFNGVPFAQASTAEQIKASTAIAMAANPELRVLRIKDGSLLDEDSMAIIAEMAKAEDYQLWVEVVGTGGVGIVIENGSIKGAAEPEKPAEEKPKAKAKPAAETPEGSLL